MKASFQRLQPRIINYRDYKRFQNDAFREELLSELLNVNIDENEEQSSNFEMITTKETFQNKGTTVCLLSENPKSYIIVILMEKRLQIIKLFVRPLNRSYLIKLYQQRN